QGPVTAAPYEVSKIINHAFVDSLSDAEKVQFLEKSWRPLPNSILDKQVINCAGKTVTTKFQTKWLDHANPLHCGGWCKVCLLFLTTKEKDAALGAFVKSAFKNYSKSKEKLDSHESADYHKRAEELQQIPFRGHRDDKIQFKQEPTDNEGNFTTIIRLLAKSNPGLKDHLEHGPQNARYTSKTLQNEVIAVMANLIRDYFCQCFEKCPHFSFIADETTSHGQEILSVCLRFLDFVEDPCCPIKREVLIDLCDLTRTTGKAIATRLTESLKKHKIDIANCRGQAYDTTSSMSSSKKGVEAEIAKCAPDADSQGCCLHALNLAICHACEIRPIQNMMDS
ncbi:Zinc finger MYM-type protein 1, partial [Acropora cervicornis]